MLTSIATGVVVGTCVSAICFFPMTLNPWVIVGGAVVGGLIGGLMSNQNLDDTFGQCIKSLFIEPKQNLINEILHQHTKNTNEYNDRQKSHNRRKVEYDMRSRQQEISRHYTRTNRFL